MAQSADLARFGYKQELRRSLFALGLTTIGGVFIWSWPIVAIGQFAIALGFAELASHYPVAGSVFQWTKYLAGKTYSWFAGWIYLFAGILTVTAVCVTLPLALIPAFNLMGWNIANTLHNQRWIAIITLVIITVLNVFGVKLVAIVNNTGVLFEILGMVVFAFVLALFHHHQSVAVIFHTGGTNLTTGTFLVAMFMSLFVIYGFDTAGTLAEETRDPRREAPRAILASIAGAFVIGGIFLFCMLLGIRDLPAAIKGGFGPAQIIESNFGSAFSAAFLMVASAAIFVCCLSIQTSTIRLCLRARLRGWPKAKAPFSLGRWGLPVNILGLAWGAGMLVNFAWPRIATNPHPNQLPGTLNFGWHWLNDQPVLWTTLIVIVAVGAVYYGLVQRTKPSHMEAPEGEVFAQEAAPEQSAPAGA